MASIPAPKPTLKSAQAQRCRNEALGHHDSILCHVWVEVRRQVKDCLIGTPHYDGAEASVIHCLGGWGFCGGDGADAGGAVGPAVTDRAGQGWRHLSRRARSWGAYPAAGLGKPMGAQWSIAGRALPSLHLAGLCSRW